MLYFLEKTGKIAKELGAPPPPSRLSSAAGGGAPSCYSHTYYSYPRRGVYIADVITHYCQKRKSEIAIMFCFAPHFLLPTLRKVS